MNRIEWKFPTMQTLYDLIYKVRGPEGDWAPYSETGMEKVLLRGGIAIGLNSERIDALVDHLKIPHPIARYGDSKVYYVLRLSNEDYDKKIKPIREFDEKRYIEQRKVCLEVSKIAILKLFEGKKEEEILEQAVAKIVNPDGKEDLVKSEKMVFHELSIKENEEKKWHCLDWYAFLEKEEQVKKDSQVFVFSMANMSLEDEKKDDGAPRFVRRKVIKK